MEGDGGTNPDDGQKFVQRNQFMSGLCKRAGAKPFGIKAIAKSGPSVLNDIRRDTQIKTGVILIDNSR